MKSIIALILSLFAVAAAAAAPVPVPPADQAAIRAFLTRLYASYKYDQLHTKVVTAVGTSSLFTPSTDQLQKINYRLANGENMGFDFDLFCACNDHDTTLKLAGVTLSPLPKGRINARVQVSNYGIKTINIQFEKTPAGWRIYDMQLPRLGMLRAALIAQNAELAQSVASAAPPARTTAMPTEISYAGPSRYKDYETYQDMELKISGSAISGVIASQAFGRLVTVPVAGTYANGTCLVQLKSDTFSGPCDAHRFSGNRLSRKGEIVGSFAFKNVDELPAGQVSPSAPSPMTATGSEPVFADSPLAQAFTAMNFGRSRLLIEPGGGCSEQGRMVKGYCFDRAIGFLRDNPSLDQVTIVTMTRSYLLGTWVPSNSGQGWNVYEIKRRGEVFSADRDRQFSTKVNPPQGCVPGTVQDEGWYVGATQGYKVAVEAKHFLCDAARSSRTVSRGPQPLPGGGVRSANESYQASPSRSTRSQPPAPVPAGTDIINSASSPAAFRLDDSGLITGSPFDEATPTAPRRKKTKHK